MNPNTLEDILKSQCLISICPTQSHCVDNVSEQTSGP
jgi:hypothetical protein